MAYINVQHEENVALVTIDRPESLNALNLEILQQLDETFNSLEQDEDTYVIVLTGSGKAFVAGADIAQMKDFCAYEAKQFGKMGNDVFSHIENLSKPVIAAVNGFALGGGCELAMSCDIRIAGEKAKFGQPETGLGICPGFGGTQRLARIVGMSRAKELIYTAETITAAQAAEIGLVSRVVPQDSLMDEAMGLAKQIASNAQIAVRQSKSAINKGVQCDISTGLSYETEAFALCFSTEDQKNAMEAFVNKTQMKGFKNK